LKYILEFKKYCHKNHIYDFILFYYKKWQVQKWQVQKEVQKWKVQKEVQKEVPNVK